MFKIQIKTIRVIIKLIIIIMFKIINMIKVKNSIMIRASMIKIMAINKVTGKKHRIITKIILKTKLIKIIIKTKLRIPNK